MGRIAEMHDIVVIVTMVTVYVAEETNILMDVGKPSYFSINGT